MRWWAAALLAAGTLAAGRPAGGAEPGCVDVREASETLRARYGEEPMARGLREDGRLLVLFARADGASWTLLEVTARGCAAVVGAGGAFELARRAGQPA